MPLFPFCIFHFELTLLKISQSEFDALRKHGEETYPHECCGVLLGRWEGEARERGEDVVGFYHSHPDHPPRWSETDLAEAHWTGCSYVITAVEGGLASRTTSFELAGHGEDDKRFVDEEIEVEGTAAAVESG